MQYIRTNESRPDGRWYPENSASDRAAWSFADRGTPGRCDCYCQSLAGLSLCQVCRDPLPCPVARLPIFFCPRVQIRAGRYPVVRFPSEESDRENRASLSCVVPRQSVRVFESNVEARRLDCSFLRSAHPSAESCHCYKGPRPTTSRHESSCCGPRLSVRPHDIHCSHRFAPPRECHRD